jgi:hypothetical protein
MNELLAAWGFKYCTGRPWLKIWPKEEDGLFLMPDSFTASTGYEINHEARGGAVMSKDPSTLAEWRRLALTKAIHAVFAASGMRVSPSGKAKGSRTMSQEISKHSTEVENIKVAAQADAGFEKILKFKKGEYFVDEKGIALGTEYIAHARAWTKCWIKFVDGEVKERKVYRVALGERPPERGELDDQDQTKWAEGLDGRPADPWVYQYLLPLENPSNGEIVIFVSSSFGGRRAVADLCSAYARRTTKIADCGQPIIQLAAADMPTKKFGKVPRPNFVIVGWDEPSSDSDIEVMPPASSKDEFRDEIPF